MIVTTTKHKQNKSGHAALVKHLAKTENEIAILAEIGNLIADNLSEAIEVMEVYQSASPANTVLHHVTVNPAKDLKREQLIDAVHRVRRELDPDGEHPFAIVIHRKTRAEVGGSKEHAHLILAGVDARGKAVDDGWTKVRTERVARELEYDLGESALLGRHHRAVLRALSSTRPDVYLWLLDAFGANPEKPQSAISPSARNLARGQNLNLPKAKASVRSVWQAANTFDEFRAGLNRAGLRIAPGKKLGVFIIVDSKERFIGAADRIIRVRRKDLISLMEFPHEPKIGLSRAVTIRLGESSSIQANRGSYPTNRSYRSNADALEFGSHAGGGRRSHSPAHRALDSASSKRVPSGSAAVGDKARARFRNRRSVTQLRRLDAALLRGLKLIARTTPRAWENEIEVRNEDLLVHKDLWGIVILPKPRI